MIIYPNKSFNKAIAIAFEDAGLNKQKSYQFMNDDPFILSKGGKEIKVIANKIRVAFDKNSWVIVEPNVVLEGKPSPVKLRGEYELVTPIVASIVF